MTQGETSAVGSERQGKLLRNSSSEKRHGAGGRHTYSRAGRSGGGTRGKLQQDGTAQGNAAGGKRFLLRAETPRARKPPQ